MGTRPSISIESSEMGRALSTGCHTLTRRSLCILVWRRLFDQEDVESHDCIVE